jgi:hypothetical protein
VLAEIRESVEKGVEMVLATVPPTAANTAPAMEDGTDMCTGGTEKKLITLKLYKSKETNLPVCVFRMYVLYEGFQCKYRIQKLEINT